ncbi:hypothetical protein [Paenibacillus sp.]|uniref:hypothetical protein n=1 Tax=Paenibacillus sp. TaxID=58172 RepID=UPI002D381BCE|nr:hypothetical protein [Paenibacillus sp.]HZG84746.1 hypothetical protein [Paenibacillus sp.]
MLKKLLKMLLSSSHKKHYGPHYGGGYKKFSSSDHFHKPKYGAPPHNQHGHGYYKKKGYSSFSS